MKISLARVCIIPLLFVGFAIASCRDFSAPNAGLPINTTGVEPLPPMTEPPADTVWTASNEIRALVANKDGLWAATAGGVLRFHVGKWTKWTRQDGLPSHEVLTIESSPNGLTFRFPTATARWENDKWVAQPAPVYAAAAPEMSWRAKPLSLTLDGMKWGDTAIALPPDSTGTYITAAVARRDGNLLVAIYGDGLWSFDGARWQRAFADFPEAAREVTALALDRKDGLWLGTRRDGIFRRENGKWTAFAQPDEPFSHNVQAMTQFHGVLWASTLDDGLVCRSGGGWKHFAPPVLSSSAPRQMTVWKDRLYVRHGGGSVDSFDGSQWSKNDLADVPRKGIYALASDDERLYAAGWGGWSEWDGKNWAPHFDVAQLKGVPILGLLPDGEDLWIATQSRGLGRWKRTSGQFRWFDERDGLSDDWVTALAKIDGHIYAGTFVGGLARLENDKWRVFPELKGLNVTAIEEDGQGRATIATRHGLWKVKADGAEKIEIPWLDSEQQALVATQEGMWVGTRTSLNYLRSG